MHAAGDLLRFYGGEQSIKTAARNGSFTVAKM
ncbi:hypothetical protein MMUC44124_01880 [Mycolicibacterium mucogenicum DSM 44124]|nr:hypothetical protein MMUC44124_01880 [Mycolicibacterium mucogenicum DSM 44124]